MRGCSTGSTGPPEEDAPPDDAEEDAPTADDDEDSAGLEEEPAMAAELLPPLKEPALPPEGVVDVAADAEPALEPVPDMAPDEDAPAAQPMHAS
jgi:hypothetical protein